LWVREARGNEGGAVPKKTGRDGTSPNGNGRKDGRVRSNVEKAGEPFAKGCGGDIKEKTPIEGRTRNE